MNNQRPKNLNLLTIRFPIPAIVSILHRISGFILFLLIPFILWGLQISLASEQSFNDVQQIMTAFPAKTIIWLSLSAFIYHFVAGIRHLLMDIHVGESLRGGRITSVLTLIVSALLIIIIGIWLW